MTKRLCGLKAEMIAEEWWLLLELSLIVTGKRLQDLGSFIENFRVGLKVVVTEGERATSMVHAKNRNS